MYYYKKIKAISLIVMMVCSLALTGCKSDDTAKLNETDKKSEVNAEGSNAVIEESDVKWDSTETKTITLSTIKNYYTTALQEIAKDYTELHPETKVEIEIIADNETYLQNFKVKMSTDKSKAPDIVHTNLLGDDEGNLISIGWLHSLDELLEETNNYNSGLKVKEAIKDPTYLNLAVSSVGQTSHLPFDLVGVGIFYNKTIFDEVGIEAPVTYEEWSAACEKLVQAGYDYPIGATYFNNWVLSSLSDWAYRSNMNELVSLPGDARFNEATMSDNENIVYSKDDAYFDIKAIMDEEKKLSFLNDVDMGSNLNKMVWETYKGIAKYFPENFTTPDDGQAYNEFMAQKTPMLITGSWVVGQTLGEMEKLDDNQKFEWGTFLFPGFSSDVEGFEGSPRGLKVAGHKMGISNKDDMDQYYRTADFLKYMYSKDTASRIYDITFANNEFVQGPSLIAGVELSQEVTGFLNGFNVEGNMREDFGHFAGNYFLKTNYDFHPVFIKASVQYINGEIDWNEYAVVLGESRDSIIAEEIEKFGYDLDSTTGEIIE